MGWASRAILTSTTLGMGFCYDSGICTSPFVKITKMNWIFVIMKEFLLIFRCDNDTVILLKKNNLIF